MPIIKKLLSKLEDEKMPLLGPNVKALKFFGLLLSESRCRNLIYLILYCLFQQVLLVLLLIKLWLVKTDLNSLLPSLMYCSVSIADVFKMSTMIFLQKQWKDIIQYVTRTDILSRNEVDKVSQKIVTSYTRYSRNFTYIYWAVLSGSPITTVMRVPLPLVKYYFSENYRESVRNGTAEMGHTIPFWVPFDINHSVAAFILAAVYELGIAFYCGGLIMTFDAIVVVIMVFIRGELRMLRHIGYRMFDNDDEASIKRNLVEFKQRQADLIKYAEKFNDCLSPIMFVYLLLSSFSICNCVYQITILPELLPKIENINYIVFLLTQLAIYCWHGNNITYQCGDPMMGLYESAWWQKPIYRREMLILMMQSDKIITLTAGPTIVLSMETFVNIIKGAYSYYTLSLSVNSSK